MRSGRPESGESEQKNFYDAAVSGASVVLRPGVRALLQDTQRGVFDLVPAEALDRVSRDSVDVATLFKVDGTPKEQNRHPLVGSVGLSGWGPQRL